MYNLFLDDIRLPLDCSHYMSNAGPYRNSAWVVVRNYDGFIKVIRDKWEQGEWPNLISFDHDLGESHYGIPVTKETYSEIYEGLDEKTGLDCAKWLCDFCMEHNNSLPRFMVHSMNVVGTENIKGYLSSFQRSQK